MNSYKYEVTLFAQNSEEGERDLEGLRGLFNCKLLKMDTDNITDEGKIILTELEERYIRISRKGEAINKIIEYLSEDISRIDALAASIPIKKTT